MRAINLTFLTPFLLAATPASAQDVSESAQTPVYGPVLENPHTEAVDDNGSQYRLSGDIKECLNDEGMNSTIYEDDNGTRMSWKGAGVRIRFNFGGDRDARHSDQIPAQCRAESLIVVRETGESTQLVLAPDPLSPSAN